MPTKAKVENLTLIRREKNQTYLKWERMNIAIYLASPYDIGKFVGVG